MNAAERAEAQLLDALTENAALRERAERAETALTEIEGLDPDEWNYGSGWKAVTHLQHIARAALVGEDAPAEAATPPEAEE